MNGSNSAMHDGLPEELRRQYECLTRKAGFFHWPERTHIELAGTDAASFLHNLCTQDVIGLAPGQGAEAFLTSVQGKTLGHILLFRTEESVLLETVPGQGAVLLPHLEKYLIREKVVIHDRTPKLGEIVLAGDAAEELLQTLGVCCPPQSPGDHLVSGLGRAEVMVRRAESFGERCFHLVAHTEAISEVAAGIAKAGGMACSAEVAEMVRIESGWPLFGVDISPNNLPQEIHRSSRAISFTKGCYLGQETVARIDALGHVNRLLVGLRFPPGQIPESGETLVVGGQGVGTVTSAVFSPRLGAPMALGYVHRTRAQPGTQFETPRGPVTVVSLPLATGR